MIDIMSFLFAIGLGFGLSCWIFGTILDKSNNIGDSHGDKNEYGAYVVYTTKKDRLSKDEKKSFCYLNAIRLDEPGSGPAGSERVRRLTEEELEKYDLPSQTNASAGRQIQNDLSSVEDEFAAWESQQKNSDLTGVFKPLNDK